MAIPQKRCADCQFSLSQSTGLFGKVIPYCRKYNHVLFTNEAPNCPAFTPWGAVQMRPLLPLITSGEIESLDSGKIINRLGFDLIPLGTDGYFLRGKGVLDPAYSALLAGDIPPLDASVIVSGILALARIPRVDLTKIPLGTSGYFLKGQGAGDSIYALLAAGDIPSLDAAKIVSGIFDEARIPHTFANPLAFSGNEGTWSNVKSIVGRTTDDLLRLDGLISLNMTTAQNFRYYDGESNVVYEIDTTGKIIIGSADAALILSGIFALDRIPTIPHTKSDFADQALLTTSTPTFGMFEFGVTYNRFIKFMHTEQPSFFLGNLNGEMLFLDNTGATKYTIDQNGKITLGSADAGLITSGKFGNVRLDLSALAQNIVFTGDQTVDGVDVSDVGYMILVCPRYEEFTTTNAAYQDVPDAYLYVDCGEIADALGSQLQIRCTCEGYSSGGISLGYFRLYDVTNGNIIGVEKQMTSDAYTRETSSWSLTNVPSSGIIKIKVQLRAINEVASYLKHSQIELRRI